MALRDVCERSGRRSFPPSFAFLCPSGRSRTVCVLGGSSRIPGIRKFDVLSGAPQRSACEIQAGRPTRSGALRAGHPLNKSPWARPCGVPPGRHRPSSSGPAWLVQVPTFRAKRGPIRPEDLRSGQLCPGLRPASSPASCPAHAGAPALPPPGCEHTCPCVQGPKLRWWPWLSSPKAWGRAGGHVQAPSVLPGEPTWPASV